MRKLFGTILVICFYVAGFTQDSRIKFITNMTYEQSQNKAKKERKVIFMDCYTTWCGPCKYMAKNIFPLKETGDAVNPNFISVSVQLDTSKSDSDTTRGWYTDAHNILTMYYV